MKKYIKLRLLLLLFIVFGLIKWSGIFHLELKREPRWNHQNESFNKITRIWINAWIPMPVLQANAQYKRFLQSKDNQISSFAISSMIVSGGLEQDLWFWYANQPYIYRVNQALESNMLNKSLKFYQYLANDNPDYFNTEKKGLERNTISEVATLLVTETQINAVFFEKFQLYLEQVYPFLKVDFFMLGEIGTKSPEFFLRIGPIFSASIETDLKNRLDRKKIAYQTKNILSYVD